MTSSGEPADFYMAQDRRDMEDQWRARWCQPWPDASTVAADAAAYEDRYEHHVPVDRGRW